jgi:hypothetical protein
MPTMFVAMSRALQAWGSDVGLTKHLYKLGVCPGAASEAVAAMNGERHAGRDDWVLLTETGTDRDAEAAIAGIARKETLVEPRYYPQIKGATGIVKVKLANVENHYVIETALAGGQRPARKPTPAEIGGYLLRKAGG